MLFLLDGAAESVTARKPLFFGADTIKEALSSSDSFAANMTLSTSLSIDTGGVITQEMAANSTGVTANKAVYLTTGGIEDGDNTTEATANIVGVSLDTASSADATVVTRGRAVGVISAETAGDRIYLGTSGALTSTQPTGSSITIVQVGYVLSNGNDLWVDIQVLGVTAA